VIIEYVLEELLNTISFANVKDLWGPMDPRGISVKILRERFHIGNIMPHMYYKQVQ